MTATTYSTTEVLARVGPAVNATRWAEHLGRGRSGTGNRWRWSVGEVIVMRALRDWPARGRGVAANRDVFDSFATFGPPIIDRAPVLPDYLVLIDGIVSAIAADHLVHLFGRTCHVIDVHAAAAGIGVTTT